jgi:hypothetical protein
VGEIICFDAVNLRKTMSRDFKFSRSSVEFLRIHIWLTPLLKTSISYSMRALNQLRRLAPELFSSTAQDAMIYYQLIRYRSHWCRHITHVLLNSIQVQKMYQFKFWKGFVGTIFLGRKVTLAKKFEIWTISVSALIKEIINIFSHK